MPTVHLPNRRGEFFTDHEGVLSTYKDQDSILSYTLDWSDWLNGDTIAESTWTANGVTISSSSNTGTTATATVQFTSGRVTNKIITAAGLTAYRTLRFYGTKSCTTDY